MSKITEKDVDYVAGLARLRLGDEDRARLVREMGDILGYMEKLNELSTEAVEPMMHALEMTNVFREDVVGESMPRDLALKTAPQHDGEYFIVPQIIDAGES